ncbi:hypothetical protein [Parashewanella tropica]|uniref:hypothetical protein n=1 Tax=Parashewanella tropica TaxID=2547970 RepID=UPI00105A09DE|nr:hypothetical protein [Parashewanella tropica]
MKYLHLMLLLLSVPSFAGNLCDVVKSKGEGHWPLPENAFTKNAASKAANELKLLVHKLDDSDYYLEAENAFMYIRGYALKTYAHNSIKSKSKFAKSHLTDWCKFIKNEAYIRH